MIAFHYFYEKSAHPKFYQPVCDLMRSVHRAAMSEDDLHFFVHHLIRVLDRCKPLGHASHINYTLDEEGYIHLESGKLDDDIARLCYFTLAPTVSRDQIVASGS